MSVRFCPICESTTSEKQCQRDKSRSVLLNGVASESPPERIRKTYRLLPKALGQLDNMVLYGGFEYQNRSPRLISVRPPSDGTWFTLEEIEVSIAAHASQLRSEHVAGLLEFGIDDTSGWAYRVFRQPIGRSIRQLIRENGPMGPRAACRLAINITRVQQEAQSLRLPLLRFGTHQIYYSKSEGDEQVSILGLGLHQNSHNYPHLPKPPHPTATFLAEALLGASSPPLSLPTHHRTDLSRAT